MTFVKQLSAVDIMNGFEIQFSGNLEESRFPELTFVLFVRLNVDMHNIACRDMFIAGRPV